MRSAPDCRVTIDHRSQVTWHGGARYPHEPALVAADATDAHGRPLLPQRPPTAFCCACHAVGQPACDELSQPLNRVHFGRLLTPWRYVAYALFATLVAWAAWHMQHAEPSAVPYDRPDQSGLVDGLGTGLTLCVALVVAAEAYVRTGPYAIWRLRCRLQAALYARPRCATCGSRDLLPPDSPRAMAVTGSAAAAAGTAVPVASR